MRHMIDDIRIYQDWKPAEEPVNVVTVEAVTDSTKVGLSIDPEKKTIHINGDRLVNAEAVYGRLKKLWYDNFAGLTSYSFPMVAITWVLYEMQDGWKVTNPWKLVFETPDDREKGLRDND